MDWGYLFSETDTLKDTGLLYNNIWILYCVLYVWLLSGKFTIWYCLSLIAGCCKKTSRKAKQWFKIIHSSTKSICVCGDNCRAIGSEEVGLTSNGAHQIGFEQQSPSTGMWEDWLKRFSGQQLGSYQEAVQGKQTDTHRHLTWCLTKLGLSRILLQSESA